MWMFAQLRMRVCKANSPEEPACANLISSLDSGTLPSPVVLDRFLPFSPSLSFFTLKMELQYLLCLFLQ